MTRAADLVQYQRVMDRRCKFWFAQKVVCATSKSSKLLYRTDACSGGLSVCAV